MDKLCRMKPRNTGIYQRVHILLAYNVLTAKLSGTFGENVRN